MSVVYKVSLQGAYFCRPMTLAFTTYYAVHNTELRLAFVNGLLDYSLLLLLYLFLIQLATEMEKSCANV